MSQYPTLYPADDDDDEQAPHKADPGKEEVAALGYALSKTSAVTEKEPPKQDKRVASQ